MVGKVLTKESKSLIEKLGKNSLPPGAYLGGGTAIALHLGHRKSHDLDFFSPTEFAEVQWEQKLAQEFKFKTIKKDWQTLIGEIAGTKFSLFYYKYPLIEKLASFEGIKIASLPDLSAMKLSSILNRGTRRDLIDVYFLARRYGLTKMFEFYDKKYRNLDDQELAIRKALVFFGEADDDEMPEMLTSVSWDKIKQDLSVMVKQI